MRARSTTSSISSCLYLPHWKWNESRGGCVKGGERLTNKQFSCVGLARDGPLSEKPGMNESDPRTCSPFSSAAQPSLIFPSIASSKCHVFHTIMIANEQTKSSFITIHLNLLQHALPNRRPRFIFVSRRTCEWKML